MVVTEKYRQSKNGFPGRHHSTGSQGVKRAIRSLLVCNTADMDMNNAMMRIIKWVCKKFGVPADELNN